MQSRIKIKNDDANSPKTRAWMEEFSQNSYFEESIDKYHRIFKLKENVWGLYEESADGAGDIWLYLIDGPEAAMLIDTGFGIGDLKGLIRHLIGDKKLFVANTHEHLDHAIGNCQFEEAYCHMLAVPDITGKLMTPHIWDNLYDQNGEGIWLDFDRKDIVTYKPYRLIPCLEGKTFELGDGYVVEMIHTPGHAAGGASYIDHKNRILFTGAMHTNYIGIGGRQPGYYYTVNSFLESLKRIKEKHFDEFDTIYPAHEIIGLDKKFILDQIQACEDVIGDHNCYEFIGYTKHGDALKYHAVGDAGVRFTESSFV